MGWMTDDGRAGWSTRTLRIDDPPDPLAFLDAPEARAEPRFYWSAWDEEIVVAATGRTIEAEASGADRLAVVAERIASTVLDRARIVPGPTAAEPIVPGPAAAEPTVPGPAAAEPIVPGPTAVEASAAGPRAAGPSAVEPAGPPWAAPPWAGPRWVGGFGFAAQPADGWDGFPPAWFWVPERLLVVHGRMGWLTIVAPVDRLETAVHAGREAIEAARLRQRGLVREPAPAARMSPRDHDSAPCVDPDIGLSDHGADSAPDIEPGAGIVAVPAGRHVGTVRTPEVDVALRARLTRAIEAVRGGRADKVVVATARRLRLDAAPDPVATLARMRLLQPGCTHFLVAPNGSTALVGATPERLLRVDGERVESMALAGTAPRAEDPDTDTALAAALAGSAKDRDEHAHVVRAIRDALADCHIADGLQPGIRRLATVQHLQTQIVGRRPAGASALDLAARLHPTPALGGSPTPAALRLIAEIEPDARGWYGGAVGWLGPSGDGDLAVVIRALLIRDRLVTAYAGAGLVAASAPDREAAEIELKLAVALKAVDGG